MRKWLKDFIAASPWRAGAIVIFAAFLLCVLFGSK